MNESKLTAVLKSFDEVQRQALVVPNMLAVNGTEEAMAIVDRRLFLFLQSTELEDLEELLDEVQPRVLPRARRRNHLSPEMTDAEKAAYIKRTIAHHRRTISSGHPVQGESPVPRARAKIATPKKGKKSAAA
ncbi:MAG TPA: hypothetical protein VI685_13535 [Candidatus Angelobacter sp.]